MHKYIHTFTLRWSDFDPNGHLNHLVYATSATEARIAFLGSQGIDFLRLAKEDGIGPVLFKEDMRFFKEVLMNETVLEVEIFSDGLNEKIGTFGIVHIIRNTHGDNVGVVRIEGAWMDLKRRKLVPPPKYVAETFEQLQKYEPNPEHRL